MTLSFNLEFNDQTYYIEADCHTQLDNLGVAHSTFKELIIDAISVYDDREKIKLSLEANRALKDAVELEVVEEAARCGII